MHNLLYPTSEFTRKGKKEMANVGSRIRGKVESLDKECIKGFFKQRGDIAMQGEALRAVIYQDSNPELAATRDDQEKRLVKPLVSSAGQGRILDLGCGVGRWAQEFPDCESYLGLDISEGMIEAARKRFGDKYQFEACDVSQGEITSIIGQSKFSLIVVSGLFQYMDDNDVLGLLGKLTRWSDKNCVIYVRETITHDLPLTLQNHWSEELAAYYSSTYRTQQELFNWQDSVFADHKFKMVENRPAYDSDELSNRVETSQWVWLWKK